MIWTHAAAAVVAAFVTLVVMQLHIDNIESQHKVTVATLHAGYKRALAKAAEDGRLAQDTITTQYQGALNESRKREAVIRADAERARSELGSLRAYTAAAAGRIRLPETPAATVAEYALTAGELLTDCSRREQELAEKADGHAADVRTLIGAWPTLPDK